MHALSLAKFFFKSVLLHMDKSTIKVIVHFLI
jgi:hypothetical protein